MCWLSAGASAVGAHPQGRNDMIRKRKTSGRIVARCAAILSGTGVFTAALFASAGPVSQAVAAECENPKELTFAIVPVISALRNAGHELEEIGPFDEVMGHAGALVHHPDGLIEGAADPRGDGTAAGF